MATTRATELGQLAKLVTVDSNGNSVIAGTFDATLPASGVVAGLHGSASSVPIMSVTAQGLIDSVGSALINTATSLSFDSATGQLTLGFSDTSTVSQTLTLDPFTTADLTEGSNLYYTDARFDSAFGVKTTADLTEGSNLYYTDVRFDSAFGDKSTTNLTEGDNLYYTQGRFDSALGDKTTDNLTEGSNLYYTTARADSDTKAAISVTDAGGDGSLTYSAGAITYTGPSASEVRAHFSGGTGVDIASGVVSIGQNVDSSSNVIFQTVETTGNVTIGGNLQVNGATTTVSSQNLSIEDNMFYLNQLESDGSPTIEVDVGFAANVNDTGSYAHTGFFRDATDATWKLFDNYTPEPDSDLDIDINHASFEYADLQVADLTAANITVSGTVDGRDVAADGTKLDGIESGATADQTKSDIDALNINADQVDGLEASQFLRSDASDDMTGTLTVSGNLGVGNTSPQNKLTVNTPNRNDSGTNALGAAVVAGPISNPPTHDFTNSNAIFRIQGSDATNNLQFGVGGSGYNYHPWIQGSYDNTTSADNFGSKDLLLQPIGGAVGIGTSSPQYNLHISGGSSSRVDALFTYDAIGNTANDGMQVGIQATNGGYSWVFENLAWYVGTNNTRRMTVAAAGNVGIGTSSPEQKLHVEGSIVVDAFNAGSETGLFFREGFSSSNKYNMSILAYDYSGAAADGLSINAYDGIAFCTGSNNRNEVMRITGGASNVGRVGIGVTSPAQKLHVYESASQSQGANKPTTTALLAARSDSTNEGPSLDFASVWQANSIYNPTNDDNGWVVGRIAGVYDNTNGNGGALTFYTSAGTSATSGSDYSNLTERVRIDPNGKVGIDTTSPTHMLHVHSNADNDYVARFEGSTNNGAGVWTGIGIGGEGNNTKAAIIFEDIGSSYSRGKLIFANNNEQNQNNASPSDHVLTLTNDKHVCVYQTGPTYTDGGDNTPLVGSKTTSRLHVNGSIQLASNNDAIVFGRGTASFLKDEELAFGWGGGWYMTDGTYLRVRNNKVLYNNGQIRSDVDMRAPIFYDQNNTAYYADPNSYSRFNSIQAGNQGALNANTTYAMGLYHNNRYMLGIRNSGADTNYPWLVHDNWNGAAFIVHFNGIGDRLYLSEGGLLESTSEMRSGSFVDRGNTAYYFNGTNTGDSIRVAGDIVAFYSDERLKDKEGNISGAIDKVSKLNGFYYRANKKAQELGYDTRLQVGVSAQEVEAVLPEVVKDAPIGQGYKTVKYDRMVPLLIEAIKEQQEIINKQSQDIDELKQLVKQLMENK